jgi:Ca2+-binding RTX toxin-like protein
VATFVAPSSGSSVISYTVADELGDTATGSVAVTVDPGPKTGKVAVSLAVGGSVDLTNAILSAAKAGLAGDKLTISADSAANTIGAVSLAAGDLVYTAGAAAFPHIPANGTATDSFGYTLTDPYGDTSAGTVSVTVANPATTIAGPTYGDATIAGTSGADIINANGYSNTIFDNGGNDLVNAGLGNATVYAGSGDVIVNLNGFYDAVSGGAGWDTVSGSQGNATVTLGAGDDTVSTGGYYNTITLGNGTDTVNAGLGNAAVSLGNGNDTIIANGYGNSIQAGNGADNISGGAGLETILLGNGNDVVNASGYSNTINVGSGTNTIVAGAGQDQVTAGAGVDFIILAGYTNTVTLNGATAAVSASQGGETVIANGGQDTLTFAGYNNLAEFEGTLSASVADTGGGLRIELGSNAETLSLTGFGTTDTSGIIDLLNGVGGYTSASAALGALHSDGHNGTLLSLGSTGSIDFANTARSQLRAANFAIG